MATKDRQSKRTVGQKRETEPVPPWYVEDGFETATVVLGNPDNSEAPRVHIQAVGMIDMVTLASAASEDDAEVVGTEAINMLTNGIAQWDVPARRDVFLVVRDGVPVYDRTVHDETSLADGETLHPICTQGNTLPVPSTLALLEERRAVVLHLSTRAYNRIFEGLGLLSRD